MQTKSGFRGDNLIGYLQQCLRCGLEERAYYVYARDEMREMMLDDELTGEFVNCPACFTQVGVRDTAKWLGRIPVSEVDEDLFLTRGGIIDIDFDLADRTAKHNERMDYEVDVNEKRVAEYQKWKSKKMS